MAPQERILRRMDDLYDELEITRPNSKERAALAGELRGLAWAIVESTRLSMDDLRALSVERALARAEGQRMPSLLTWLSHRGLVPAQRLSSNNVSI